MGAILGLGVTHYPPLAGQDEHMARILERVLQDPDLPERYRRPDGWPAPMREEYGADRGLSAAKRHREALVAGFRDARRRLDEFAPDVVLIWGDDQYENFREDIIPPFCVLAYESIEHRPWAEGRWKKARNAWDEASDATFVYKGHRAAAKIAGDRAARRRPRRLVRVPAAPPSARPRVHEYPAVPRLRSAGLSRIRSSRSRSTATGGRSSRSRAASRASPICRPRRSSTRRRRRPGAASTSVAPPRA